MKKFASVFLFCLLSLSAATISAQFKFPKVTEEFFKADLTKSAQASARKMANQVCECYQKDPMAVIGLNSRILDHEFLLADNKPISDFQKKTLTEAFEEAVPFFKCLSESGLTKSEKDDLKASLSAAYSKKFPSEPELNAEQMTMIRDAYIAYVLETECSEQRIAVYYQRVSIYAFKVWQKQQANK